MGENYDFSGWATKNGIKCADGRVILENAFEHDNGNKVPLVWNHQHDSSKNILGHALLENRKEGVYAYCSFNDSEAGRNAKLLVEHGDVTALSIYANQLKQRGSEVIHGAIREVSLVLAGANPGAFIDNVVLAHSNIEIDEEAIIYNDGELELTHSEEKSDEKEKKTVDNTETKKTETPENEKKTVKDVWDSMTEEQQTVAELIIGKAIKIKDNNDSEKEGEENMKHNVFDNDTMDQDALMHSALDTIIADGKRCGSLKESFLQHSEEYGITNIDWLFPDAKNLTNQPGFIKRNPDAWVDVVMSGVHHTPFSRIKMMFADLREDEARAKGYTKGKLKKEEVFGLLKRTVDPTTIYKKQKLDRDDIIDITDFDVVSWLKGEMRMMLDEEIARAIVFGDGRTQLSEDKISETNIIPIVKDADLYSIKVDVKPESGESFAHAFITAAVKGQDTYEGSGNTVLFTSTANVTDMLLMENTIGNRIYKDTNDLALAMSVSKIVKVPASIIPEGIYGVIVDLKDYNLGADKGGSVNMFDDFDIDYNQQKYLIETRCSGALVKPYSAIVLKKATD